VPSSRTADAATQKYHEGEHLPVVTNQSWGPHGLGPSLFEANMLAEERKKDLDLESSADDLVRLGCRV
jgi:hypothetical protein